MADKPKIRFKGFTDAWEQRKFSELYERSSEKNDGSVGIEKNITVATMQFKPDVKVTTEEYLRTYYTFNLGDIAFEGHQSKEFKFGRFVENDIGNGIVSHIFAVFRPIVNYDLNFWKYLINNEGIMQGILSRSTKASTMMHDLVTNDFLKEEIIVPSIEEQIRIGECFKYIDNLLTLHQRKCDELKKVKKFMLQNLFPKNGEKYPAIRFEGFTDAWEQRKLSDEFKNFIVPMRDKPKEFGGNIPWTRIEDIEGKYLNDSLSGQYVTEETINQMNLKIIPKDSLIVSSSATFGVVAVITQDLITNQTFIGLVPNDKETLDYWYAFFHSDEARKYMGLQSAGSTIFYIARESFENMPIKVPTKDEMIKIGTYFDNLDNLITLHQRKCDEIKEVKKFMLQNMFV
ncbi:MAG: restriction endonuclease subunit S [Agathobacter sp.]|nr:restriction endonuclease subunit S [Agathobacter sp.]